jgi:hypothetical protein
MTDWPRAKQLSPLPHLSKRGQPWLKELPTCHGLKYNSRNETSVQRAMHRADRIANRLDDMWVGVPTEAIPDAL